MYSFNKNFWRAYQNTAPHTEGGAESKMQPSPLEFTFQSEGQAVNKHTHNIWSDGGEKVRGRCVMGVLSKLGN